MVVERAVDLTQGTAFVVTDLHGEWEPYARYRDHFLSLRARGEADILILLGDVIHGYGPPEHDHSVEIVLDIRRLQGELGRQSVILLLGNHEMSHIYYTPLTKGDLVFMPRFEHALGERRAQVTPFLRGLPFVVRTAGGALLTHAGAAASTASPEAAARLLSFSHEAFLAEVDRLLARADVLDLLERYFALTPVEYDRLARENLAVSGPDDPRYLDLLRGFIAANLEPEWPLLWDFFFTRCETELGERMYGQVVERFLEAYSAPEMPQRVLVTGHIVVQGGHAIIAGRNLRLASWAHARPNQAGRFLLFDVSQPVGEAADLEPYTHPLP